MKGLHLLRVAWTESRFRLAAGLVCGLMAVSFLVRLVLLVLQHAVPHGGVPAVLAALGAGLVSDALAALWVTAPFALYLGLVPRALVPQPRPKPW